MIGGMVCGTKFRSTAFGDLPEHYYKEYCLCPTCLVDGNVIQTISQKESQYWYSTPGWFRWLFLPTADRYVVCHVWDIKAERKATAEAAYCRQKFGGGK